MKLEILLYIYIFIIANIFIYQGELEEIKERNPIFQLKNEFPTRTILKPNLIKSRYFRSAKGTPNQSFDKDKDNEYYDNFDINEVLDPKFRKKNKQKKSDVSDQQNQKFNPFKKNKGEKNIRQSQQNEQLEDSDDENDMEIVNNMEIKEKNENDQKYQINKVDLKDRKSSIVKKYSSIEMNDLAIEDQLYPNLSKEENEKENGDKGCSMCQSSSLITAKIRQNLNKKINPCLVEPQEIE